MVTWNATVCTLSLSLSFPLSLYLSLSPFLYLGMGYGKMNAVDVVAHSSYVYVSNSDKVLYNYNNYTHPITGELCSVPPAHGHGSNHGTWPLPVVAAL